MAWIESHQELARHPKTKRFARQLGVSIPTAIGYLHLLWWWAMDYAKSGYIGSYDPEDIADAVLWEGDPQQFWKALADCGFLDQSDEPIYQDETTIRFEWRIHDWDDYAGKLIERRQADADRKRSSRLGLPSNSAPDVQQIEAGHPMDGARTVPNLTGPDQTGPDRTKPETAPAAADVPPERRQRAASKPRHEKDLAPVFEAFTAHGLSPGLLRDRGPEQKAAGELIRSGVPPGDIAECWGDIRAGHYGNQYARENLSFVFLANQNRIGNWQAWRDAGKPAAQERTNGRANGQGQSRGDPADTAPGPFSKYTAAEAEAERQRRAHSGISG